MFYRLLSVFILTLPLSLSAQKIQLINSADVIKQGIVLYDSGNYEAAINTYRTIDARDTNYVYMLTELALAYTSAKDYPKAIEACKAGLAVPSRHRAHLLRSYAVALDHNGEYDQSVALFLDAIKQYPFDYSLRFNLGITYYNHHEYEKAEQKFFEALRINPFHAGSHLNLGRLSAAQGRKTQAMMAMGMYLGVNPNDNSYLVFLDHLVKNEFEEEGSITAEKPNQFERLDKVIGAKLAMDKRFKTKIPSDVGVVRQFEMFFDQLPAEQNSSDNPWVSFYLPIYQSLKKSGQDEAFIYHIITSAPIEVGKKWRNKNEKKLKEFFALANAELADKRTPKIYPEGGFTKPTPFWYNDNHALEAIGVQDANKKYLGKWIFFYDNGERSAVGEFNSEGKKIGVWNYYYSNGKQKSIEDQSTGEIHFFNWYGEPTENYFLKDEEIDGNVNVYFPCGALKENLKYKNGLRSGPGKSFFIDGNVESEYTMVDDKFDGKNITYYSNGKVKDRTSYKNGEHDGKYEGYHANGKLKVTGTNVAGKAEGPWLYYHATGRLSKKGNYKNDLPAGEWEVYDSRGRLAEKYAFNDKGELEGEDTFYQNGKLLTVSTYDDDKLVKIAFFDNNGKKLSESGDPQGNFSFTGYHLYGQKSLEGKFKNGKRDGQWIYYHPNGNKETVTNYVEGVAQGAGSEYFFSGKKKFEYTFKDDEYNGYYTEYFENGKIKIEGWFQDGVRQQRWITYFADGSIESDYYYLNGDVTGTAYSYAEDGRLNFSYDYRANRVLSQEHFKPDGKPVPFEITEHDHLKQHRSEFLNHKTNAMFSLSCGSYVNDFVRYYPDGSPFYKSPSDGAGNQNGEYRINYITGAYIMKGELIDDKRSGKWSGQHYNGQPSFEGNYVDGEQDSTWVYYYKNGKVSSRSEILFDKRNGLHSSYNPEGILVLEKIYVNDNLVAYRTQPGEWVTFTGEATIKSTFPNGKTAYEENYKNGVYNGTSRMYYSNGNLYSEITFVDGDYLGEYKNYHPNGKIQEKGTYIDDELDGRVEYYNDKGELEFEETYLLGARNGKSIQYKNGVKVKEVNFWGGFITE